MISANANARVDHLQLDCILIAFLLQVYLHVLRAERPGDSSLGQSG